METSFFEPSEEYLKTAVNVPSVVKALEEQNYNKPLFMIMGLKVVRGASKALSTKKLKLEGDVTAQGDLTSLGAPGVAPGVNLGLDEDRSEHIEWESAEPYVFAFRLREIYYRRGTDLESKTYTKGALYSEGNEQMAQESVPTGKGKAETQIRMTAENEEKTKEPVSREDGKAETQIRIAAEHEEKAKKTVPREEGKPATQIRMMAEDDVTLHDLLPEDEAGLNMTAAADEDDEEECVCISMLSD